MGYEWNINGGTGIEQLFAWYLNGQIMKQTSINGGFSTQYYPYLIPRE